MEIGDILEVYIPSAEYDHTMYYKVVANGFDGPFIDALCTQRFVFPDDNP